MTLVSTAPAVVVAQDAVEIVVEPSARRAPVAISGPVANPELPTLKVRVLRPIVPAASAVTVTSPILFSAPMLRPVCGVVLTEREGFEPTTVIRLVVVLAGA